MNTSDFWYDLPEELIAQTPLKQRDASRMLHLDKETGAIEHRHFTDILDYLRPGDCLILNDTRVLPARIYGVKEETGAVVEFLLLKQRELDLWECLCKPGKRAKPGTVFSFGDGRLKGTVTDVTDDGGRVVKFTYDGNFYAILEEIGQMPLPPYIKEKLEDQERYQTVYSNELGSAAAPTAGLHFTPELLKKVEDMGVAIGKVTLHVGLGTFRPVKVDNIEEHKMHSEHYWMPKETADLINRTKANGGRVIAVGTTSGRTLESGSSPSARRAAGPSSPSRQSSDASPKTKTGRPSSSIPVTSSRPWTDSSRTSTCQKARSSCSSAPSPATTTR